MLKSSYGEFYLAALRDARGVSEKCHRRIVTQQLSALFGRRYEGLQQYAVASIIDFVGVCTATYPSAMQTRARCKERRFERRLRSMFFHLKQFAEIEWMDSVVIEVHWLLGEGAPQSTDQLQNQRTRLEDWPAEECTEIIEVLRASGFQVEEVFGVVGMIVNWSREPVVDLARLSQCSASFRPEVHHIVSDLRSRTAVSRERTIFHMMESIFQGIQETTYGDEAYINICAHATCCAPNSCIKTVASFHFDASSACNPYECLFQPICQRLQTLGYELFMFYSSKYINSWCDCLLCIDWGGKRPYVARSSRFHDTDWVVMSPYIWMATLDWTQDDDGPITLQM